MERLSEKRLLHLLAAGARERRYMETQRQTYEKLREMEAEEKARRAQQHEHDRAYYFSIALKRGAAPNIWRPLERQCGTEAAARSNMLRLNRCVVCRN